MSAHNDQYKTFRQWGKKSPVQKSRGVSTTLNLTSTQREAYRLVICDHFHAALYYHSTCTLTTMAHEKKCIVDNGDGKKKRRIISSLLLQLRRVALIVHIAWQSITSPKNKLRIFSSSSQSIHNKNYIGVLQFSTQSRVVMAESIPKSTTNVQQQARGSERRGQGRGLSPIKQ